MSYQLNLNKSNDIKNLKSLSINSSNQDKKPKYLKTIHNSKTFNNKLKYLKYNLTKNEFIGNDHRKLKKLNIIDNNKVDKVKSMNEVLNKLIKVKHKLNRINIIEKKEKNNLIRLNKQNRSSLKLKLLSKSKTKNKYLLYINDYYKNKLLLKKNKTGNFETENTINNKEENNNIQNHKTINTITDSSIKHEPQNSLEELRLIKSYKSTSMKNKAKNKRILSLDSLEYAPKNKIIERKKIFFNTLNKNIFNKNKVMHNHIKYIEKIKDNELMDLINRFKKSLNNNKKLEMSHFKSLVFPIELINYLIHMKRELIIDKYRNEYLTKIEKYNIHNVLSEIRHNNLYIIKQKENINNQKIDLRDIKFENNNNKLKNIKLILNNDKKNN